MFVRLTTISTLHSAWQTVKSKGAAGGIDGLSLLEFEKNLQRNLYTLLAELKERKWLPAPYMKIEIPKKTNEKRTLGLLSVKDKIVQTAIKTLIEPRFEDLFASNSYGYRPGKGHLKAIRRTVNEFQNKQNKWVAQLDIDNYFDTVSHEILFARLSNMLPDNEILRLIDLSVKMGMVTKKMKWQDIKAGVPQGAILSPLLANFYLHPFDQSVTARTEHYVRYADDFLIFGESREQIEQTVKSATEFLQGKLLLKLNEPTIIQETTQPIEFLGIMLAKNTISVSDRKFAVLRERIQSIRWKNSGFSVESLKTLDGIEQYYAKILPKSILQAFDNELKAAVSQQITFAASSIASKKQLSEALSKIRFFTSEAELEKKGLFAGFLAQYAEQKQNQTTDNQKKNQKLIKRKKLEYQRREAECSEMVVSSVGSFIGISQNKVRIKVQGKEVKTPPTNALKHITITTRAASISAEAVHYCVENHIPVDFFDNKGNCYASIIKPVSIEYKLWQQQAAMSNAKRQSLALHILIGKLKNQLYLLKYFHKYHKKESGMTLTIVYESAEKQILVNIDKLKNHRPDDENYQETFTAVEAQAAVAYWGYVKVLLADDKIDFDGRERQGASDLFNSMLNYGYAIIYPRIWQALLAAKLNPSMGVLHKYQSGKPVLVYDFIEIFRAQAVDRVVISLVQKSEPLAMDKNLLDDNTRKLLIQNILERLNRYEKFRGEECRFEDIIRKQMREAAAYISGENKTFKPYIAKW
ncbi:hypothetical protein AGMMS49574_20290 [Bacteroidia bacterium]|nr:hypothetical protein AGMMS49574_20290 [Bacteroidia bacterium]